jgi:hypothetical protein
VCAALLVAASPSGAAAATDLSGYLAPPPDSTWNNVTGNDVLDGPFTAHSYAAFVAGADATPNNVESDLTSLGFLAGFAREWYQPALGEELIERIFQFKSASGATEWYQGVKSDSQGSTDATGSFDTSTIPDSFGVILRNPGGSKQWRLDFMRGPLVFIVHTDAANADLASLAVRQAGAEYDLAGSAPRGVSGGAPSTTSVPGWILWAIAGTSIFVVLLIAGVLVSVLLMTGRPRQTLAHGVTMSPDGYYWWDGSRWRLVATDPPPR